MKIKSNASSNELSSPFYLTNENFAPILKIILRAKMVK